MKTEPADHSPLNVHCGFDISGKEIRMETYIQARDGSLILHKARMISPMHAGFKNIMEDIAHQVRESVDGINMKSLTLSMAIPARFQRTQEAGSYPLYEDGSASIQQPISGISLGEDCWNKDWVSAIKSELSDLKFAPGNNAPLQALCLNDGNTQMEAILEHAQHHNVKIHGKVAFAGPGTDLATSIGEVDSSGSLKIRHNAHCYDLMVEISPEQEARIRKLFGHFHIKEWELDECRNMPMEKANKGFGNIFPLMDHEPPHHRQFHILKDGDKRFVIPSRIFSARNGISHLLEIDHAHGLKDLIEPAVIPEDKKMKIELIGELFGEYFVQMDRETMQRVPLPGIPPVPYDKHVNQPSRPLGAILLGGGGLRDQVGEIIEGQIRNVIQQKGSEGLKKTTIYRPDQRRLPIEERHKELYNICLSAVERGIYLLNQRGLSQAV